MNLIDAVVVEVSSGVIERYGYFTVDCVVEAYGVKSNHTICRKSRDEAVAVNVGDVIQI
jgi:hypothetical protein